MSWLETFLQSIVDFTATLDPRMALLLFAICALGEIGISILFLLEFLWVNVGINVGTGALSVPHLMGLWVSAQVGRQLGSAIIYRIARFGMPALTRFYHKIHLDRLINKLIAKSGAIGQINITSPFSIAFARLIGMRWPMILLTAAKKRFARLALGVGLSSIIFDGLYISAGAIFGMKFDVEEFNPIYTVLITVGTLAVIYLVTFSIRYIIKRRRQSHQPVNDSPTSAPEDKST